MAILGKLFGRKRDHPVELLPLNEVPDLFAPDLKDIREEAQRLITVFGRLIQAQSVEGNVETGQFKELSDATIEAAALIDEFEAAIAMEKEGSRDAGFLDYYDLTGGLARWGYPLSEVFEENPGNFVQYYQRGAVDWHFRDDLGIHTIERRLGWDLIGGGRGGSTDMGGEPGILNPNDGVLSGPWGHKVSNQAVDGTVTGFLDFFQRLGGELSFGVAKTDARPDTGAPGTVMLPDATPGFIRQYFQAAVIEFHPSSSDSIQIALIGYNLRALAYPGDSWTGLAPFASTDAVPTGVAFPKP